MNEQDFYTIARRIVENDPVSIVVRDRLTNNIAKALAAAYNKGKAEGHDIKD